MDPASQLSSIQSPSTMEELAAMKHVLYHEAVGSLMYATLGTCPDICYAVQTVSKFNNKPRLVLSEDTSAHRSLQQNMSTLTFRTHSASPTLCTSLHINSKFHFPQIVLSMSPSVPTLCYIPYHRSNSVSIST